MSIPVVRLNEIAMLELQRRINEDGMQIKPDEIARHAHNRAKQLGIPVIEAAEFFRFMIEKTSAKTMDNLGTLIVEEISKK